MIQLIHHNLMIPNLILLVIMKAETQNTTVFLDKRGGDRHFIGIADDYIVKFLAYNDNIILK